MTTPIITGFTTSNYYGTGTWTPGLTIGGSSTGITYSGVSGFYYQHGLMVWVKGIFTITATGGLTGNLMLTGLPVNTDTTYTSIIQVDGQATVVPVNTNSFYLETSTNATTGNFMAAGVASNSNFTQLNDTNINQGGAQSTFKFSGWYLASTDGS